jgi:hypothetical protein
LKVKREGAKVIVTWQRTNVEDVEKSRELFVKLTREGWLAFLLLDDENNQQRILEFNPEHGRLRFIPLSEGG